MKVLCLLVALVVVVRGHGETCTESTECGKGECCAILADVQAIDRRGVKTGKCERFTRKREFCQGIDKINGHCGCEAGTKCRYSPGEDSLAPFGRDRRFIGGFLNSWRCLKV